MTPSTTSEATFPANPLASLAPTADYHRRVITGILESYNSNYDVLGELVQNAIDAVEDAALLGLGGPYRVGVHIDLQANTLAVLDTGIGMEGRHVVEALAPMVSFKNDPAVLRARANKAQYRGYKGVGLTFIAYGTDDVRFHSKRADGGITKARMQYARSWATGNREEQAVVVADEGPSPLDDVVRGTYVRVQLSANTRPKSLFHIASDPEVWSTILRTRTAIGQILLGADADGDGATEAEAEGTEQGEATQYSPLDVEVELIVTDINGVDHELEPPFEFLWPHGVERRPRYRFLDVADYWATHGESTDISVSHRRQDGIYFEWGPDRIREQLTADQRAEHEHILEQHNPQLYGFLPYQSSVWQEINETLTGVRNRAHLNAGLVIGVNRQRLADSFEIPATRFETLSRNFLTVVHFDNARPDQGRKTVQDDVMLFAQHAADRALQYAARQRAFLKPAGERPSPQQREVERTHEDWVHNVRNHAQNSPLHVPPLSYQSIPQTEQDVVGLFHQLTTIGVFPGVQVYATSQSQTYDCLVKFEAPRETPGLRYRSTEENSLGVSPFVLGDGTVFRTRYLTAEFKNNLDALIEDVGPESSKDLSHIHICICWSTVADSFDGFTIEKIVGNNIDERAYPGTTHLLRRDADQLTIQVIMLADIIDAIEAGRVPVAVVSEPTEAAEA